MHHSTPGPLGRLVADAGSPILEMARRAAEYRAAGRHIIDLTLGEPAFAPPTHAIAAAQQAAALPLGYTLADGIPELRQAARGALEQQRGLNYTDDEVAVGCDAKQVIFNDSATLEEGCRTIVATPSGSAA
jgi:aspartate aminotransferase